MAKKLYKTTIVIWTDYLPGPTESIVELSEEATAGDAYCSVQKTELIEDAEADSDWDGTEFFE